MRNELRLKKNRKKLVDKPGSVEDNHSSRLNVTI